MTEFEHADVSPRLALALLALLLLLGLGLRLYRLEELVYGFHPDEAYNGLDALQIIDGWRPAFLPRNNGREPLFIYLMAGLVALYGPTIWAARLTGALAGTAMIAAQYTLTAHLPLPRPRLTGLAAATLVATTFWPVHQSHKALRAGLLPVWIALLLWTWWQSLRYAGVDAAAPFGQKVNLRAVGWAALSGLFLAAAVYTHLTGRLLPLILLLSAVWVARPTRLRSLLLFGVAALLALVLSLPQIVFFGENPDLLTTRINEVSILNSDVSKGDVAGMLLQNGHNVLLMFNVRGSTWIYENLPGRPVFDPLIGLFFLLGVALIVTDLLRWRGATPQAAAVPLALLLGLGLASSWLSAAAPSYIRLTALWPVAFLLPAWGLERATGWIDRRAKRGMGTVLVVAALGMGAVWSSYDLFAVYANTPQLYRADRIGTTNYAYSIHALLDEGVTYISPTLWAQPVVRFINHGRPLRSFNLSAGLVVPPDGDARYVFDPIEVNDEAAFSRRWPRAERGTTMGARGEPSVIVYRLSREDLQPLSAPTTPAFPTFGDRITLKSVKLDTTTVKTGETVQLTLVWEALAPTALDHNFFVHLVDAGGRGLAQVDGPPLKGSYPTNQWAPGELILQTIDLTLPRVAPAGPASLHHGWYDWRDGSRLPIAGDADDALEIARFMIVP